MAGTDFEVMGNGVKLAAAEPSAAGGCGRECRTADQQGFTGLMKMLHSPAVVDQVASEQCGAAAIRQLEPFNHAFGSTSWVVGCMDGLHEVKTTQLEMPMAPVRGLLVLEGEQRRAGLLGHGWHASICLMKTHQSKRARSE
jgi:hypothetical protein